MMGKYWYDNIIKEMQTEVRWTLVATEAFFKYDEIPEISNGRYSKTPCKVFVFKNSQEEINTFVNKFNTKTIFICIPVSIHTQKLCLANENQTNSAFEL